MSSKSKALPKGMSAADFDKAVRELRAIVGDEHVLVDEEKLAPYRKIAIPVPDAQHELSASVTPDGVEQIQRIMKVANKYRMPVYPISTGKNIGYGSAALKVGCTMRRGSGSASDTHITPEPIHNARSPYATIG